MSVDVSVTSGTALDANTAGAIIDISFTNTDEILYAANSKVYYYVKVTDSASPAVTKEIIFSNAYVTEGSITANSTKNFVYENTDNLVAPFTGSDGKICYKARP